MGSAYRRVYTGKNPTTKFELHKEEKNQSITLAKEEEKKIFSMGLGELSDLACQKALSHKKDWYMTCVSCGGVQNCMPGRRVLEILEQDTKPDEKISAIDKFNARTAKANCVNHNGGNNRFALIGREGYLKALQQPDPISYIAKMNGTDSASARRRLYKWRIAYPDIDSSSTAAKISTHASNPYVESQKEEARKRCIAAFTYPGGPIKYIIEVMKIDAIRGRYAIKRWATSYPDLNEKYHIMDWYNKTKGERYAHVRSDRARQQCIDAFTYPDGPAAYIKNVMKVQMFRGKDTLKRWAKLYPDIDKKYHILQWIEENKGKKEEEMLESKYRPDYEKKEEEVSVSDFLAEMEEDPSEEPEKVVAIDTASMHPTSIISEKQLGSDSGFIQKAYACKEYSAKRIELLKKIDEIKVHIAKLEDEQKQIQSDIVTLDAAAKIMGFAVKGEK